MKCLNKKFLDYFLVFFLLSPGLSIAEGGSSAGLNTEAQELICIVNTSSLESQGICLKDKVNVGRVTFCSLYTSTYVAEALCLKNKELNSNDVLKCFIGTPALIEQICLVGSETSNRIISYFEATGGDLPDIIGAIENIKTQMENLLDGYKVRFDITQGEFNFHSD